MKKKIYLTILIILLSAILSGTQAYAKSKPVLSIKSKTLYVGDSTTIRLKHAKTAKWKVSDKSVISIIKKKKNTLTIKAKNAGTAVVTATYKGKKYSCKVRVKKKKDTRQDNTQLNADNVTLYYLDEEYKDYITYDKSHIREFLFKVSGTDKEVKSWKVSGEHTFYFHISSDGLLTIRYGFPYEYPYITATVTATLTDGRVLTANVRAYSEVAIYTEQQLCLFEEQYITPDMTEKEKVEKAAWYIGTISDYEKGNGAWISLLLAGKGDCQASRYAVMHMCQHMGIKALACWQFDYHGETLVKADGKFYIVITGFNEPRPRSYMIFEVEGAGLQKIADDNKFRLEYFDE